MVERIKPSLFTDTTVPGLVTKFADAGNGSNVGVSWMVPSVSLLVDRGSERAHDAACELAWMPLDLAAAKARVAQLEQQLADARAALPPSKPANIFDGGCVRLDSRGLWLLSKPETGWSAWGVRMDGWDDLFRRFDVIVGDLKQDEHGQYWLVHPRVVSP